MEKTLIGIYPLASSSSGNCIYFGTPHTKLLIDCGISGKQARARLDAIGVDIDDIDAVLVTHEHIDHIRGVKVIAKRHNIPVIVNADTARAMIRYFADTFPMKIFTTGEPFEINEIRVHPFSVQHDSVDPVMFTLQTPEVKVGVCTDLGFATSLVKAQLQDCHYLFLESNHEPDMVHACARPMSYKQRVLSRSGHLSNSACGELIRDLAHSDLRHVHLGHLSSECNHPERALATIGEILERERMTIPLTAANLKEPTAPLEIHTPAQKPL